MKDALAIHRMLLERETQHEIVRLPRPIANADELPDALRLPAERCLVTRVYVLQPMLRVGPVRATRQLAVMINSAGAGPAPEAVRAAMGARTARQAPADVINRATDYTAELVAPLLLPETLPLLVDERVTNGLGVDDVVYTATGEAGVALGIKACDLFDITGAKPVPVPLSVPQQVSSATLGRAVPSRPTTSRIPRNRAGHSTAR